MTRRVLTAAPERDRVSQVYLGLLDVGPTGDWLRRRIDWMAGEAHGPSVLDVGCSEGILEVLLARRGIAVTGVEIDSDAIDFARQLLAKESDEVRARVKLVQGDFIRTRPVAGLFDTVVMGELLDYLDDPGAMLDRGLEHLRPGGRVVITTPFGVHPHEDLRRTFCLTDLIGLLKPRLGLELLSVEDNHIRFVGRLSEDREVSWESLDAKAVLSMTDAALVASQRKLYGTLAMRGSRIERLQQRLQQRVEAERTTQRKVNTGNEKSKKLEFRVKLDRIALGQLRKQVNVRTEEVKARTREVEARAREVQARTREVEARTRELRVMSHRLQTTRSSTSFLVGSALVSAAKRPLTLWKLPFRLLQIFRSKSTPPPMETVVPDVSSAPHAYVPDSYVPEEPYLDLVPEDAYPDPSRFMDFPLLPIPEVKGDGPPVAAILDTFTEYSLRHEVNLLLMSPKHWRAQMEKTRPVCLLVESAWRGNNGGWRNRIVGYEDIEDNPPAQASAVLSLQRDSDRILEQGRPAALRQLSRRCQGVRLRIYLRFGLCSAIQGSSGARPYLCPAIRGAAACPQPVQGERLAEPSGVLCRKLGDSQVPRACRNTPVPLGTRHTARPAHLRPQSHAARVRIGLPLP